VTSQDAAVPGTGCSTSGSWTRSCSTRRSSASWPAGARGSRGVPRAALGP
jgi:hypothetical protein